MTVVLMTCLSWTTDTWLGGFYEKSLATALIPLQAKIDPDLYQWN